MSYMDGHGIGCEQWYDVTSVHTWWWRIGRLVWWQYSYRSQEGPGANSGHLYRWYLRVRIRVRTMHSSCRWWILTLFSMYLWSSSGFIFVALIMCASIRLLEVEEVFFRKSRMCRCIEWYVWNTYVIIFVLHIDIVHWWWVVGCFDNVINVCICLMRNLGLD